MIIVGYPCIGKTTLSNSNKEFIDLESSLFKIDGVRDKNWYKYYIAIANDISLQGKNIFVSSHKEVRDELLKYAGDKICVFPSLEIKDKWVDKLKLRYENSNLEKDRLAYEYTKEHFEEAIKDMKSYCEENNIRYVELNNINYNLYDILLK